MNCFKSIGLCIFSIILVCTSASHYEKVFCNNNSLNLSDSCYVTCREKLITFLYTFSHHEIELHCKFSDSWKEFSKVRANLTTTDKKSIDLTISNFDFSHSINIYNITDSLSLDKIDSLKLTKPNNINSSQIIYHDERIKKLIIDGGKIYSFPEKFIEAPNLNILKISNTLMKKLKINDLEKLKNLLVLDLSHNTISIMEYGTFENLVNLCVLDISFNKLTYLPNKIFNSLQGLRQINLESNRLKILPDDLFHNNKNLSEINLKNNLLRNLPKRIFKNLKELTTVDLSNNILLKLEANLFQETPALKFLYLQSNNLEEIPLRLFWNTSLISLRLGSNKLKKFNL